MGASTSRIILSILVIIFGTIIIGLLLRIVCYRYRREYDDRQEQVVVIVHGSNPRTAPSAPSEIEGETY